MWFSRPDPHRPKAGRLLFRALAFITIMPPLVFIFMLVWVIGGFAGVSLTEAVVTLVVLAGIAVALGAVCFVLFEFGLLRIEGLEESDDDSAVDKFPPVP